MTGGLSKRAKALFVAYEDGVMMEVSSFFARHGSTMSADSLLTGSERAWYARRRATARTPYRALCICLDARAVELFQTFLAMRADVEDAVKGELLDMASRLGLSMDVDVADAMASDWLGGGYEDRLGRIFDRLSKSVLDAVRRGLVHGSGAYEGVSKAVASARKACARLLSTEANRAYNLCVWRMCSSNDVQRVRFSVSPNERRCPVCSQMDGVEADLEEAYRLLPPFHPNCMCRIEPLVE